MIIFSLFFFLFRASTVHSHFVPPYLYSANRDLCIFLRIPTSPISNLFFHTWAFISSFFFGCSVPVLHTFVVTKKPQQRQWSHSSPRNQRC